MGTRGEEEERANVRKELVNNGQEQGQAEGRWDRSFHSYTFLLSQLKWPEPENRWQEKTKSIFFEKVHIESNA